MKKINVAGISSVLGGAAMYGYVALGNFMGKSGNLKSYNKAKDVSEHKSLYDILESTNFDWIDSLPAEFLQNAANYVVTMPLWLLLIIVGSILLVIGGIFVKR